MEKNYGRIGNHFNSLAEVTKDLRLAGVESLNLIVGIDFTKSNEWTGATSFRARSLHHIGDELNPYEQAITIIGNTLSVFNGDNMIPCYGFGDVSTRDSDVFSFFPDDIFCNGFKEVLSRYKNILPHTRLAEPTSFAPIIEMAMTNVAQSGGQYHVLVIITDGQVTRSVGTGFGELSPQEKNTVDTIVEASMYPLSIVLVGVGDGPWDAMEKYDNNIPARLFDNFQFLNFTEIMSKNMSRSRKEAEFALAALMEIPSQYKAASRRGILGRTDYVFERYPLPPPACNVAGNFGPPACNVAGNYSSLKEVTEALLHAGLESSSLILGIDFTKSNEWTGATSYGRRSLHHIGDELNPYEQAITIIGKTLAVFDNHKMIPCYGFGDVSSRDSDVFSFFPNDRFCNGFEEVLSRYKEILPHVRLAETTSFAPIIEMAMNIVAQSGGQYHVLVIIANSQVTRSIGAGFGELSPQEKETVDAIVEASMYCPLSIVIVGVGDGPWDTVKEYDNNIPARLFNNLRFVNFTEIMSKNVGPSRKAAEFALAALMGIPSQYKVAIDRDILGRTDYISKRLPLPPPVCNIAPSGSSSSSPSAPPSFTPGAPSTDYEQECPICWTDPKNMAFGCGHQTCRDCGKELHNCPICRAEISIRINLYI